MTTEHVAEVGLAAFLAILIAVIVAHGALQTFLEARGVQPWRLGDTLLATPLIIAGAGAIGGGGAAIAHRLGNHAFIARTIPSALWIDAAGLVSLCAGVIMLTLGVRAIRKLT
jgi:hypothetical protein